MSNKLTISCEADLADVELEEGLAVLIQDSGKILKCITGYDGRLTWQTLASSRYDLPAATPQLQEIEYERSDVRAEPKRLIKVSTRPKYLH